MPCSKQSGVIVETTCIKYQQYLIQLVNEVRTAVCTKLSKMTNVQIFNF